MSPDHDCCEGPDPNAEKGRRLLWTIEDAMRLLSCSKSMIYDLASADRLELVKIGRNSRITDASLRRYVADLVAERPKLYQRHRAGDEDEKD